MKKFLNAILAICLALFVIGSSVIITMNIKSIYYNDIDKLNIESMSNLSREDIIENYDYLIDYNLSWKADEFELPSLPSSHNGKIHFEEVRNIFQIIKKVFYLTGLISILGIILNIKDKNIKFLNITSITTILLPVIVSILLIINFNYFFIKFHEAVFSNDYWIFDPDIDPVINILPEDIFFHIGILILAIVFLTSILLQVSYRRLNKKLKN